MSKSCQSGSYYKVINIENTTQKIAESCSSNVIRYADFHTSDVIVRYCFTVLPGGVGACGACD